MYGYVGLEKIILQLRLGETELEQIILRRMLG
jgi:hypothetical protein